MSQPYIPPVTNWERNPGAEVSTLGWTPSNLSLTSSSDYAWYGTKSFKCVITSISSTPLMYHIPSAYMVPVVSGDTVEFSVRIQAIQANRQARFQIQFYQANGTTQVGSTLFSPSVIIPTISGNGYNWAVITSGQFTTPATAVFCRLLLYFHVIDNAVAGGVRVAVGDTIYADGFDARKNGAILPYVAGDMPHSTWNGTPNDSTSYRNGFYLAVGIGRGGVARVTTSLLVADKLNNFLEDISKYMISGAVEMRIDRRIKMRFSGRLRSPNVIHAYSDYLAPFMRIEHSNGLVVEGQLGLFSIPPMGEESSYLDSSGGFEGLDLAWNVQDNSFGNYYTVQAGANVVDTVIAILATEGFTRYSIPASSKTFPKTRTYDITRNKWNVVNAMLGSIGYYRMWVSRVGVFTSMPYIDYDQAEPARILFAGKGSDIVGSIKKEPLKDQIYNKVRVIGERPKTNTPIIQTLINSNPLSPTSTVSLGRTRMMPVIKDSDINDTATALEVARSALQHSSSLYTRYELATLPDPTRDFFEVYESNIERANGEEVMAGRYRVNGWDITLDAKTPMRHFLNRNEAYV